MLPQAKKLFRFRFPAGAIVIVLAILLCSSGHEGVIQESCSQAASALMKVDGLQELLQKNQDQFFVNLLDCSKEIHNQILEAPKSDNCETMNYKAIIPSAVLATVIDDGIPRVNNWPFYLYTSYSFVTRVIIFPAERPNCLQLLNTRSTVRSYNACFQIWHPF